MKNEQERGISIFLAFAIGAFVSIGSATTLIGISYLVVWLKTILG